MFLFPLPSSLFPLPLSPAPPLPWIQLERFQHMVSEATRAPKAVMEAFENTDPDDAYVKDSLYIQSSEIFTLRNEKFHTEN